ncbi:MAG: isocitrate lyase/PEP mutase family protein, partial [Candidatus Eremiobacteraeota bacterium]|nr:isocitrate lyase/PEP mutase family protein [Candidatus Eremiobacteraeota bacterium]
MIKRNGEAWATSQQAKNARLRALIQAPEILVMPGVYDGFSAHLSEERGFLAGFITGSGLSEARFGRPDVGLMGLFENVDACRTLASITSLPLIADGDTGYGNAVNVFHATQAFEAAGVSGVMFEDQVWPKRCGHMAGKELISADEMVQKIRAAADARRDKNFIIKARTDAAGPIGIDAAIDRLNQYADAGADLLFADAVLAAADIEKLVKGTSKPVSVNMGFGIRSRSTTPLLSAKQLEDMGVAAVILPRMLTAAAIKGMQNAFDAYAESLASGKPLDRPDLLVGFEELNA